MYRSMVRSRDVSPPSVMVLIVWPENESAAIAASTEIGKVRMAIAGHAPLAQENQDDQ